MKPRLKIKLDNGGEMTVESKIIPRVGEDVIVEGRAWGPVERVVCVYDRGEGDHYVVYLGPRPIR